jgi:uncharacterized GH25 family protein
MIFMRKFVCALFALTLVFSAPALAHELILKPAKFTAAAGEELSVELQSTHVFIVKEEVEEIPLIKAGIFRDGKIVESPMRPNEPELRIDFSVKIPDDKASTIILANKSGEIRSRTPDGSKVGTRKSFEDQGIKVTSASKTDKFSKAIINASASDKNFAAVTGQELELIPVTNPADIKAGGSDKYFQVKVLLHGQPAAMPVWATYDGFAPDLQNTYAYYTESGSDGIARIKITSPGLWIVRASKTNEPGVPGEYDFRTLNSILTVSVK